MAYYRRGWTFSELLAYIPFSQLTKTHSIHLPMSVYHSLEESQSDSPSTCSSLVVCVQNGGQGSRITHLSHAPPPGVYIITHAQNVFLLPSFINVRLCTCVVVVCIFSNLCLLLTDLVLTCGVKLYIYFLCGKMFSFRRASFRLSLQKETAKNGMSHLWRLLAHRIGVASSFHNAQMDDSSCNVS